jgi:hypothetical protein
LDSFNDEDSAASHYRNLGARGLVRMITYGAEIKDMEQCGASESNHLNLVDFWYSNFQSQSYKLSQEFRGLGISEKTAQVGGSKAQIQSSAKSGSGKSQTST